MIAGGVLLLGGGGLAAVLLLGSDDDSSTATAGVDPTSDTTQAGAADAATTAAEGAVRSLVQGATTGDCAALDLLDETVAVSVGRNLCASQSGVVFFGTLGLQDCELAITGSSVVGDTTTPTGVSVGYTLTGCRDVTRNQDETLDVKLIDTQWRVAQVPGFLAS